MTFTVARKWCGAGFPCAAVDGAAPTFAVETDSPATPKVYRGTTLAATRATATSYSLLGEIASITEASGGAAAATATYAYDASGLPTTVTVGATEVARFAYDAAGNRASAWRPDAGTTSSRTPR